ncbi:Restriction endonuclease, type II, HinP1I [Thiovulum sp. ES]|nr:Restriction endonuclease, type II, HinP1I [Thiovulum sp. ES]
MKKPYIPIAKARGFTACFGKKTSPKADIRVNFKNDSTHYRFGISIKSSSANIQVQITNVDNFRIACEFKGLDFSDLLYIGLSKFCGFGEYKPTEEQKEKLLQGNRDRWLINELEEIEQREIEKFFNKNQKSISELVLKEGTALEEFFADYYLVNRNEYSKTGDVDFCIEPISEVIDNSIAKNGYKTTPKGSFHIGSITVQMKGSGKGEAYHGLQFNKKGC